MGFVQITMKEYKIVFNLPFNKIDIDREGKANNYETIRVEFVKLQFKAYFCMVLKLGMTFVFAV